MIGIFPTSITATSHTYFDSSNRLKKYQDAHSNQTTYTRNDKDCLTSRILKRNTGTVALPNLIDYQQTQCHLKVVPSK